jgi:hypothetical protein
MDRKEEKEEALRSVLPQKIVFQASFWQLDHQILKSVLDSAISTSHGK